MDDLDVIKSVQAGDSETFSLLVQKYHRHLLNFIYRLMGDGQIVEDIGQDVFLSIYKSIRSFDVQRGVPFSAWLFITARNRCVSELRRRSVPAIPIEDTMGLRDGRKTPEEAAAEQELNRALYSALEQLPEPYRCTILQSLQGNSPEEIAADNGISAGTVKSRLFRAREKLRLLLHDCYGGSSNGL